MRELIFSSQFLRFVCILLRDWWNPAPGLPRFSCFFLYSQYHSCSVKTCLGRPKKFQLGTETPLPSMRVAGSSDSTRLPATEMSFRQETIERNPPESSERANKTDPPRSINFGQSKLEDRSSHSRKIRSRPS